MLKIYNLRSYSQRDVGAPKGVFGGLGCQNDLKPIEIWGSGGCHLSTIPGTTPHCLVSTGGDVNF